MAKKSSSKNVKKFHAPSDFPDKATKYVAYINANRKKLPELAGNSPAALKKLSQDANKAKPLATKIDKAETALAKLKDDFQQKTTEAFSTYMENLNYAREYADRHGVAWFEKGLAAFKAHDGGHGHSDGTTPPSAPSSGK